MEQKYQYRELFEGKAKKTGKPFTVLKLHNPDTLEPVEFFLQDSDQVDCTGLKRKDVVIVTLRQDVFQGRVQLAVAAIRKAN